MHGDFAKFRAILTEGKLYFNCSGIENELFR
jgi:hypothetical protein